MKRRFLQAHVHIEKQWHEQRIEFPREWQGQGRHSRFSTLCHQLSARENFVTSYQQERTQINRLIEYQNTPEAADRPVGMSA